MDTAEVDPGHERVAVVGVAMSKRGLRTLASVTLRRGSQQVTGTAEGPNSTAVRWRIVADAALDALRTIEPMAADVSVEMAGVQRIGERALGIVTLVLAMPPDDELLAGVAPVRDADEEDAVVRAVLDATNRRLARLRASR